MQKVSAEVAIGFAMTDDGFDGGSPPQFLLDLAMDAALLAGFEDPPRVGGVVAPVALVHIGPLDLAAGQHLGFLDHVLQGVAVPRVQPSAGPRTGSRIAGQGLGVQDELTARAAFVGGGERDLDAELVRFGGFSLTDVRSPMKAATDSDGKAATDSDLKRPLFQRSDLAGVIFAVGGSVDVIFLVPSQWWLGRFCPP